MYVYIWEKNIIDYDNLKLIIMNNESRLAVKGCHNIKGRKWARLQPIKRRGKEIVDPKRACHLT